MAKFKETAMHYVFLLTACVSIAAVAVICVYLLANGIPTIAEIGLGNFFGLTWKPSQNLYGIVPFIVGSIYVTAGPQSPLGSFLALYGLPLALLALAVLCLAAWLLIRRIR